MGGFAFHGARDSIDEQRRPSKAVPHGPQPVGLLLCPTALLMTRVTTSMTAALAAMVSTHPAALMSATKSLCRNACTCIRTKTLSRLSTNQCLRINTDIVRCKGLHETCLPAVLCCP